MQLNVFADNSGNFSSSSIKYGGSDADGAYSWMSKLNGYNAEGYTAIAAGDFDGNGKETVVFYDPAKGNLMLKSNDGYYQDGKDVLNIGNDETLKKYFGKTLNEIQTLGGTDLDKIAENTAMVQLEAADLDGASRFQKVLHIDLPSVIPTAVILLIMNCGRIMSQGAEKAYLMQNAQTASSQELIATYVYKMGLINNQYSYSTAIGLFNSLINIVLLVIVNTISKRLTENSLW